MPPVLRQPAGEEEASSYPPLHCDYDMAPKDSTPLLTSQSLANKWLPRFVAHSKVLEAAQHDEREDGHLHLLKIYDTTLDLLAEFDGDARANKITASNFATLHPSIVDTPLGKRNVGPLENPFVHAQSLREFADSALDFWEDFKRDWDRITGRQTRPMMDFKGDVGRLLKKRKKNMKMSKKLEKSGKAEQNKEKVGSKKKKKKQRKRSKKEVKEESRDGD